METTIVERMLAKYCPNLEVGVEPVPSQSINWETFLAIGEVIKSRTFVVQYLERGDKNETLPPGSV